MSFRVESVARCASLAFFLLMLAGCYDARRCGTDEVCNYADDDCDGRYDEDFRDSSGAYVRSTSACGGCGIDCGKIFPTALETACEAALPGGIATCRIVSCAPGFHRSDEGGCAPDLEVLCRPCRQDLDCTHALPGAICADVDATSGLGRCYEPCDESGGCSSGLECLAGLSGSHCMPLDAGFCECGPSSFGQQFACLLEGPTGLVCEGRQTCEASGLGVCRAVAVESCDYEDDDCDGLVDEGFVDTDGRYATRIDCGGCDRPCAPPGPNMSAECVIDDSIAERARCETLCLPSFVDVDGIAANGCECERWTGSGPPPSAGGDVDCDGIPDDSDAFVYVSSTGSDTNPGTLAAPVRTLPAAIALGASSGRDVLVSRGLYAGPVELVAGVSVFGGYRPDFRDRDLTLYPVVITAGAPGRPALVCSGITTATQLDGVTLEGSDAIEAGAGSTAAYFDGCSGAVLLHDVTVFVGHGADGRRGTSSAENLATMGYPSIAALDGVSGGAGIADPSNVSCRTIPGGQGGAKTCAGRDVSGGRGGASGCPDTDAICSNATVCPQAGCTDYTTAGVCDFATVLSLAMPNGAGAAGRGALAGEGGEATYNSPTNRSICEFCDDNPTLPRDGVPGVDGLPGSNGVGGMGCSLAAVLDVASGRLRGGDGTHGTSGTDGSGGGGGSGGAGYDVIPGTASGCSDRPGGSGGGAGSGGCGAPLASAGQGGGASVGIVVRFGASAAGPTLVSVRVVLASGGRGGDGGIGAAGGTPGSGAAGGGPAFWCARSGGRGGDGGAGGAGGGGGGGCGGGAHGVAIVARGLSAAAYADSLTALVVDATGTGGLAGLGGYSPGNAGGDGLAGRSDAVVILP